MSHPRSMTPRFWTCALVTNLSAFVRLTYAVAAMSAETGDGGGAGIYDLSQSVALIVVAITCTAMRSRIALGTTAFFATLLQFFDGIVGLLTQDPTMKYGQLCSPSSMRSRWHGCMRKIRPTNRRKASNGIRSGCLFMTQYRSLDPTGSDCPMLDSNIFARAIRLPSSPS
jgi:hypothetical protein